jgi:hypothetical protein
MNKHLLLLPVLVLACSLTAVAASPHQFGLGARYHMQHSVFTELPFDEGDMSYALCYEYHSEVAFWQIVADIAPDVTGTSNATSEVDYLITPQLNLVFKDRGFVGGIGVLTSYVHDDDPDWLGPYGQFLLGVELPIKRVRVELLAYYPFEDFGAIEDFDFEDVEYGGFLMFTF